MYLAIDGNSVGKQLERYILNNNVEELQDFSQSVCDTISNLKQKIIAKNGKIFMNGGDNIFATCSRECAKAITNIICEENEDSPVTYSVAVGDTMQDTYMALKFAKSNPENPYIEAHRNGNDLIFLPFN